MKIAIINGPNLNLLGQREPEIYGSRSFEDFFVELTNLYAHRATLSYFQSNIEGELIDAIQKFGIFNQADAIVLNAAGYSHTSVSIADAVKAAHVPVIEVHISNIYSREQMRHTDLIAPYATGLICGLGLTGYKLAIDRLLE